MHSVIFTLALLTAQTQTTLAADSTSVASHSPSKKSSNQAKLSDFINLIARKGTDYTLFADRRAALFGFPHDGAASKALAQDGNPARMCNLVVDSAESKNKPVCLVLQSNMDFPDQRQNKNWHFRFALDGSLEKAVTTDGALDEKGNPVPNSGVLNVRDIKDPEVLELAQKELQFWLRAAYAMLKQESEAAKHSAATSSGSKSGKPAKPSWSDELH